MTRWLLHGRCAVAAGLVLAMIAATAAAEPPACKDQFTGCVSDDECIANTGSDSYCQNGPGFNPPYSCFRCPSLTGCCDPSQFERFEERAASRGYAADAPSNECKKEAVGCTSDDQCRYYTGLDSTCLPGAAPRHCDGCPVPGCCDPSQFQRFDE